MFIVSQAVKISGYNFVAWAHGNRVLTFYDYIVSFYPILFHPQGSLSHLQSSKTIILYGSFSYFFCLVVAHGGPRNVSFYSGSMMKLYVSLLSRNYDIFSGFDIRLAAQPVAATFSFGRTVVCFHATICAHTLDTALRPSVSFFSLFDLIF